MRSVARVPVVLSFLGAALLVVPSPAGGRGEGDDGSRFLGTWSAEMEHGGSTGELVVRIERTAEEGLVAVVSLPTIDAWAIATLPVEIEDGHLDLGLFTLEPTADDGLAGVLPEALVPVHRIPFVLRRSAPRSQPAPAPIGGAALRRVWSRALGSPVWAGLALHDGRLLVGTDDGELLALDPASGETAWTARAEGAIRGRATASEQTIYLASDGGLVSALASRDGTVRWTARVAEPVERVAVGESGSRYDHYASSPRVAGDDLFVGTRSGAVVALARDGGEVRWRFETGDLVTSTPAVTEDVVVAGSFDGRVYGLDRATGAERWRFDTGAAVPSSPAVAGDLVVIGSRSYDLFGLSAARGEPRWTRYLWYSWIESSAVVRDGVAYVGSSDAQLVSAVDAASGRLLWQVDVDGSVWSEPAVTENAVVVGTVGVADYLVDHHAHLLVLDPATGAVRAHHALERPDGASLWGWGASPAVDDERIYAATIDGKLTAYHR